MTPYYERDGITIYCGDCLEVMLGLEPGFDAVIADLPYGTTACDFDKRVKRAGFNLVLKALDALKIDPQLVSIFKRITKEMYSLPINPLDLWPHYKRLVKSNGAVLLFGGQPFTTMLINSNLEWFKYEWVWDKINPSGFLNVNIKPLKAHENVLVFYDKPPTYNPQMTEKPLHHRRRGGYTSEGKEMIHKGVYQQGLKIGSGFRGEITNPISIITITTGGPHLKKKQSSPTQKPVALMCYLIRTYTNPGDIILDNAMGSGTTLVAAQSEGRRAVGIELSEEYCQAAVERLRQPSFFSLPVQTNRNVSQGLQASLGFGEV